MPRRGPDKRPLGAGRWGRQPLLVCGADMHHSVHYIRVHWWHWVGQTATGLPQQAQHPANANAKESRQHTALQL